MLLIPKSTQKALDRRGINPLLFERKKVPDLSKRALTVFVEDDFFKKSDLSDDCAYRIYNTDEYSYGGPCVLQEIPLKIEDDTEFARRLIWEYDYAKSVQKKRKTS